MMEKLTALWGSRCAHIACITDGGAAPPGAAQAPADAHPIKISTARLTGFNILARDLISTQRRVTDDATQRRRLRSEVG